MSSDPYVIRVTGKAAQLDREEHTGPFTHDRDPVTIGSSSGMSYARSHALSRFTTGARRHHYQANFVHIDRHLQPPCSSLNRSSSSPGPDEPDRRTVEAKAGTDRGTENE
ncbi:hypothetical protein SALBM311S_01526 [Streptomyces alboniger]